MDEDDAKAELDQVGGKALAVFQIAGKIHARTDIGDRHQPGGMGRMFNAGKLQFTPERAAVGALVSGKSGSGQVALRLVGGRGDRQQRSQREVPQIAECVAIHVSGGLVRGQDPARFAIDQQSWRRRHQEQRIDVDGRRRTALIQAFPGTKWREEQARTQRHQHRSNYCGQQQGNQGPSEDVAVAADDDDQGAAQGEYRQAFANDRGRSQRRIHCRQESFVRVFPKKHICATHGQVRGRQRPGSGICRRCRAQHGARSIDETRPAAFRRTHRHVSSKLQASSVPSAKAATAKRQPA